MVGWWASDFFGWSRNLVKQEAAEVPAVADDSRDAGEKILNR